MISLQAWSPLMSFCLPQIFWLLTVLNPFQAIKLVLTCIISISMRRLLGVIIIILCYHHHHHHLYLCLDLYRHHESLTASYLLESHIWLDSESKNNIEYLYIRNYLIQLPLIRSIVVEQNLQQYQLFRHLSIE